MAVLPSFEAITVPEGEFVNNSDVDTKEAYKALQKQRKLEGKFTSKKLRTNDVWSRNLNEVFEYGLYESKFEDHKEDMIIYGFQEDNDLLLKIAAILSYSTAYTQVGQDLLREDFTVLKVSKNYSKQFEFMPNAHHVKDILAMKTPLNDSLADIVTAHKFEEQIDQYSILNNFETINHEMTVKYKELKKFVLANTQNKKWHEIGLLKEITKLCEDNKIVNQEMIDTFQEVEEYFAGAELLKYVKYTPAAVPAIRRYMALTKGDDVTLNTQVNEDMVEVCISPISVFVDKVQHIDYTSKKEEVICL